MMPFAFVCVTDFWLACRLSSIPAKENLNCSSKMLHSAQILATNARFASPNPNCVKVTCMLPDED